MLDEASVVETANDLMLNIDKFGFLIAFSAITLIVLIVLFIYTISVYKRKTDIHINAEVEKNNTEKRRADLEMDMVMKERRSALEQNTKLFEFMTTVQSEQIEQMKEISQIINDLKEEVKDSRMTCISAVKSVDLLSGNIEAAINRYAIIDQSLSIINESTRDNKELSNEMIELLKEIKELLMNDERTQAIL